MKGKPCPPLPAALVESERALLESRGLLDAQGKITPVLAQGRTGHAGKTSQSGTVGMPSMRVPKGDVTIEHIQHAFYMAANYGFQILNGNFAAAIDDYELKLRFMNDLATYRIDVSWLWTLVRHQAVITKDGYLQRPALTEDGVVPAPNDFEGHGRHSLHAGIVPEGVGLSQRMDGGVFRRVGPPWRREPLRPR